MPSDNPNIQDCPHELLNAIFSSLAPWELVECALVCKGWLAPAQGCLYEDIDVRRAANKLSHASRSSILRRTLDANPSLRSLVHSLRLVAYFPSTVFPKIRSLSLHYATYADIPFFTEMLAQTPTLEHVSFHTNVSLTVREHFLMLKAFGSLPGLKRVRYFAPFSVPVQRKPGTSQFIQFLDKQSPQSGRLPQLQTLDLRNVTELGSFRASLEDLDWAFHPRSPIDLSRLRALRVSTYRAAKHIMLGVGETLESLTFTSASRHTTLNDEGMLVVLPVLKYLCIPSETIDISLVNHLRCPLIERITILWQNVTDLDPEFLVDSDSPLYMLDRCVTNRANYPVLKEIVILVKPEDHRPPEVHNLQKRFPRCYARGIAFMFSEWLEREFE